MTPARKSRLFGWWFARHTERRIRQTFSSVYIRRLKETMEIAREAPILLVSNHTSWWDPMVSLYLVPRRMKLDGYAMMDELNLAKLPFFGKVGAFGVDLSGGGAARESLEYAAGLLDRPGRLVWIFPQGRERASTRRPLGFRRGSAVVALVAKEAAVVPFGIRYEVAGKERPYLFLSFGPPLQRSSTVDDERASQELAVTEELELMDGMICSLRDGELASPCDAGFEVLLSGRRRLMDQVAQSMLSLFTGGLKSRDREPGDQRHRSGASSLPIERAAS